MNNAAVASFTCIVCSVQVMGARRRIHAAETSTPAHAAILIDLPTSLPAVIPNRLLVHISELSTPAPPFPNLSLEYNVVVLQWSNNEQHGEHRYAGELLLSAGGFLISIPREHCQSNFEILHPLVLRLYDAEAPDMIVIN